MEKLKIGIITAGIGVGIGAIFGTGLLGACIAISAHHLVSESLQKYEELQDDKKEKKQ